MNCRCCHCRKTKDSERRRLSYNFKEKSSSRNLDIFNNFPPSSFPEDLSEIEKDSEMNLKGT
jgi:hypothetical protein